ncbi:MAG: transglycosylase SLT domain-containing protein [Rhodobacteraceae bacterium]|nr:transglycosylase SLT domain-containing protein [Paracoccaceae bacterium]
MPSSRPKRLRVCLLPVTFALALLTAIVLPRAARATADLSAICDEVAVEAARQIGVPLSVLRAISLTETGRKRGGAFRPWPWTVNMEGKGLWFDTEAEAKAYVAKEYARGARSFDVGCFQINYRWHGEAFRSVDDMFDPLTNALYAARFLSTLYAEKGAWGPAAGAYHSRNSEFADKYQARFERIRQTLVAGDEEPHTAIPEIPDIVLVANGGRLPDAATDAVLRINRFPLLQTGQMRGLGSLVPIGTNGAVRLFGPAPTAATGFN